jgi:3-deoxy-manno-octulosonate cytidylyltransferase (CMP-KDO synthetase)
MFKQVCIYGFSRNHLKFFSSQDKKSTNERYEDIEILRFLDFDIPVNMIKVDAGSYAVDTPEDLTRIRQLMA